MLSSEKDMEKLVSMLDGYSNDSICIISKKALALARKRNRDDVCLEDYKKAIELSGQQKPNRREYMPDVNRVGRIGFSEE